MTRGLRVYLINIELYYPFIETFITRNPCLFQVTFIEF